MGQAVDRQDIQDLCARYALALDERDWAALGRVFTEDAVMSFAHVGEVTGREAIATTCGGALEALDASQHLVGTILPVVEDGRARCASYFQAQHVKKGTEGGDQFVVAGRYDDELSRTAEGWLIVRRVQRVLWTSGNERVVF